MKKKYYQKPLIEKVNLNVTESVLTACKLATASTDPHNNASQSCTVGSSRCSTTEGS